MPFQKKNELDKNYNGWLYSSKTFWEKIEQSGDDACWAWLGSMSPGGPLFGVYKQQLNDKPRPRMTQARRVMWAEQNHSWPPENMPIYHGCGNKACMNPEHWTLERPKHIIYRNYREQQCEQD